MAEEVEQFGVHGLNAGGVVEADLVALGVIGGWAMITGGDGVAGDGAAVAEWEGKESDIDAGGVDAGVAAIEDERREQVAEKNEEGEEETDAGAERFRVAGGGEDGPRKRQVKEAEECGESWSDPAAAVDELGLDHKRTFMFPGVYFPLWY